MEKISNQHFNDERSLFTSRELTIEKCSFSDGESPLKESQDIEVKECTFSWKYPLWYCKNVLLMDSTFNETARSGIWYTENISIEKCAIIAPKTLRKSKHIKISKTKFENGLETLWACQDIHLMEVVTKGDYFGFNSSDIQADNLEVYGNYVFDSCKNITIRNSYFASRDSFWNCENVTLINCTIIGEYFGWNSKNVTLINCKIESHQGMCYMDGLKMYNCEIYRSDLIFEYCRNLDVEIKTVVDSVKNPISGQIVIAGIKDLILDKKYIDPSKIKIIKR